MTNQPPNTGSTGNPAGQPNIPPVPSTTPPAGTIQNPVQTSDHAERYWAILQNNVEWVRFSDSKAGVILTTYGVLFTIIYTNANAVFTAVKESSSIHFLVWAFGLSALASVACAFWAIRPRLKAPGDSILYFKHIYENNVNGAAYKTKAKAILDDEVQYTDHLALQIWSLSKVATNKYNWTSYSIYGFCASIVLLVLMVIIYADKILAA